MKKKEGRRKKEEGSRTKEEGDGDVWRHSVSYAVPGLKYVKTFMYLSTV